MVAVSFLAGSRAGDAVRQALSCYHSVCRVCHVCASLLGVKCHCLCPFCSGSGSTMGHRGDSLGDEHKSETHREEGSLAAACKTNTTGRTQRRQ